jgi:hypothetical protein
MEKLHCRWTNFGETDGEVPIDLTGLLGSRLDLYTQRTAENGALAGFSPVLMGVIMKKLLALVLIGTSCMLCVAANAQSVASQESSSRNSTISNQDVELLRKDLRAKRKQLIAANLRLTESEAERFWPIYDQYIKELIAINDKKFAQIQEYAENYGKMTNDQSLLFIRNWLDYDIATTQLRQKYVPIVAKVLDGKKTATFFQLDRRIAMMIELQVSSQMPLVQDQQ